MYWQWNHSMSKTVPSQTEILTSKNDISSDINQKFSNDIIDRKYYFSWVLTLFLLMNFTVLIMLFLSKRRQQKYQNALFKEKEQASVTLHPIGDAVITTDLKGNITFFNDVAEMLTEYKNEEVQGLHIDSVLNLYSRKTGKKILAPIYDVMDKDITIDIPNTIKLVSRTGKEYILSDSPSPIKSEKSEILGTVLLFRNDTEHHKTEEVLTRSESKYRSLVENVQQHYFFYAHDTEGIFTYLSNSLTDILGYTKKEFKTHYSEYMTNDPINEKVEALTKKSIQGVEQKPYSISMYRRDGSVCYLEVAETPVYNSKGEVISVEGVARDITDNYLAQENIKTQKELLAYKAHHDTLTDLPNRELFLDRLTQSIKYAERFKNKVAVLFIDLDHFKEINDTLGHHVGDEVLKILSRKLKRQIRETDTLARIGGDEFILILDTLEDANIIVDIIMKLMDTMNEPIIVDGHQIYVTLSIGVSLYPDDASKAEKLLINADAAMYEAKENGRNTYCFYTEEMTQKAFERIEMETSLYQALEREEFVMNYLPQFNAVTGKIVSMEVLLRWQHPQMGMLLPGAFIPLAEEIGLIIPIDKWVMEMAMKQLVLWDDKGLNSEKLTLNLSLKQLNQPNFIKIVSSIFEETGCKHEWIAFEITETQIMKNPEHSILILQELSDMGIELIIDNFGTGYSSISYLKHLPVDTLKIDRSFVKGLPHNDQDAGIIKALIILAKSLELNIIAEGVETDEQERFLIENGCSNIQGYLYTKPISANEIMKMLKENME